MYMGYTMKGLIPLITNDIDRRRQEHADSGRLILKKLMTIQFQVNLKQYKKMSHMGRQDVMSSSTWKNMILFMGLEVR